jgi:hypothetical protein
MALPRKDGIMPSSSTIERAKKDKREGKASSTQAGEFVREEMEHIRHGKHGARSTKQAIAIGLSKARRAGVPLPPPARGKSSERTREQAARDYETGQGQRKPRAPSAKRSRAVKGALEREGRAAASRSALSRQATQAARKRTPSQRSEAAKRAAAQRTPAQRSASAKRAAQTRRRRATASG